MKKLTILVIFILIMESLLTGLIPHSKGLLFHYLQLKSGPIYFSLLLFFFNYLFLDFFQSIKGYFITRLAGNYRFKRSIQFLDPTLKLPVLDNIPQRIQEDIKLSYQNRFSTWAEYFISGTIVIQLIILNISYPLLSGTALLYALLSVLIAYLFNPRLTTAEKDVQIKEANYRQQYQLVDKLHHAIVSVMSAEKIKTQYLLFTKLQLGLLNILPYLVLIPSLLTGVIDLGTLVKHQSTFTLIVINAAILIQCYPTLIKGRASEERVKELENEQIN